MTPRVCCAHFGSSDESYAPHSKVSTAETINVASLKQELSSRGLSTYGLKPALKKELADQQKSDPDVSGLMGLQRQNSARSRPRRIFKDLQLPTEVLLDNIITIAAEGAVLTCARHCARRRR